MFVYLHSKLYYTSSIFNMRNVVCVCVCVPVVHGQWAQWSAYSICSKSCGTGVQQRTRQCSNPAPQYGGDNCIGSGLEETACQMPPCPPTTQPTTVPLTTQPTTVPPTTQPTTVPPTVIPTQPPTQPPSMPSSPQTTKGMLWRKHGAKPGNYSIGKASRNSSNTVDGSNVKNK